MEGAAGLAGGVEELDKGDWRVSGAEYGRAGADQDRRIEGQGRGLRGSRFRAVSHPGRAAEGDDSHGGGAEDEGAAVHRWVAIC